MIHRIYSSLPSFKTVVFGDGFNILIADKTDLSTQGQTRNSAGKSSLVEIVHFLMGARCGNGSIFLHDVLIQHSFGMDVDVSGVRVGVERSGATQNDVQLLYLTGDRSAWPETYFREGTSETLTIQQWRELLGRIVFGLHAAGVEEVTTYRPTFRSLFGYFARRSEEKGFLSPIRQSEKQKSWDQQVMLSYLLDLDWTVPREFELVKGREAEVKTLKRTAAAELRGVVGGTSTLRNRLASAEERVVRLRQGISEFRVLAGRNEHQADLNAVDGRLRDIRNADQADSLLAREIERALKEELPPSSVDLRRLYGDAGVSLPDSALRRFEEVRTFHESVLANRRNYLGAELEAAKQRSAERARESATLDGHRANLLRLLHATGALEEFTALQTALAQAEAEVESLRARFSAAQNLETTKADLDVERRQLVRRLQQDYAERGEQLREAIVTLGDTVSELYADRVGQLLIEPTTSGAEIKVKIEGDRGGGIANMEIFAFDLMLMRLVTARGIGPGFLIHDSHLFDGVDMRQRATALMVARRAAESAGWQYIVTMNSDELPGPEDAPEDFRIVDAILPTRLTDDSETGGLFGLQFD